MRLYLTDLNVVHSDIDNKKSDLLRFYAKVQTSRSKTRSAYALMDPCASHCYIDTAYARQLGLPFRHAGRMLIIPADYADITGRQQRQYSSGRKSLSGGYGLD